ncbi:PAS domain S-box protein [Patescibacteria group bacterium]|nr:PAS domain S-box protein [Patescibacteria group bacterium]
MNKNQTCEMKMVFVLAMILVLIVLSVELFVFHNTFSGVIGFLPMLFGVLVISMVLFTAIVHVFTSMVSSNVYAEKQQYDAIMSAASFGVCVISKEGSIVSVNSRIIEILGEKKAASIVGKDVMKLFDLEKVGFMNLFHRSLEGQSFWISEHSFFTSNKKRLIFKIHGLPLRKMKNSAVDRVILVIEDITERKEVQERYQMIARNVSDVIWTLDLELNYTYISPSVFKQRGFTPEEILKGKLVDSMDENSFNITRKAFQEEMVLEKKGKRDLDHVVTLDLNMKKKDGSFLPVEIKTSFIRNEDGIPVGILGITRDISERIKNEEELKIREVKYRTLFESAANAIYIVKLDGKSGEFKFVDVNHKGLEIFGCKNESEFLGKNFFDISAEIQEDGRTAKEIFKENVEKVLGGEPLSLEWLNRRVDGSEFFTEINMNFVEIGGEKFVQVLARDITSQKEAVKALKDLETMYNQVSENAELWLWEVDPEGLYMYSGIVSEKILGYKVREIVGKKYFYDFFHPDDRDQLKRDAFLAFKSKEPIKNFLNRNVDRDGNEVWLLTSAVPNLDKDGNLIGYRGIDVNNTEVHRAQEALIKSEENYRAVFDSANDAFFIHDISDGKVLDVNQKMLEMYGFSSKDEVVGAYVGRISSGRKPYDDDGAKEKVLKAAVEGPQVFEWECKKVNGEIFWAEVSLKKVNLGGEVRVLAMVRDISGTKKNVDRIHELDQLKSRFISSFSHVARKPLNEIKWGINTLLAGDFGEKDEKESQFLQKILGDEETVEQMLLNVNLALEIEKGTVVYERVQGSLVSVVTQVVEYVKSDCKLRGNTLNLNVPADEMLPNIEMDVEKMKMVLLALISNSNMYSKNAEIVVSVFQKDENIEVRVIDNGIGIPELEQKHVFEIFFRGSNVLLEYGETAGLGLYLAKNIIEAHGGKIGFTSKEGEGSSFWVSLPISQNEE